MQLKLKSFFNAMAFCMSLAWKTSKHYTIGRCTLLILSTCTPYISMFLNKILIDSLTIINEKNYFSILFILILVMLMAIITKLFSKLSAYYQNIHSDLLEHEIEKMVMKKTMKTNIEFYDSPEYLNTLQAVMTDFFSLNEITWNIFYGMSGICSLIIAAGMIGRYQWSYAIVLLIFSIPSAVLNQKFSKKAYKLRLNNMPYERQQSYMYSVASDRYFAFDIRLHNLCDFFMNRYKKFWSICFKDRKQLKKKQLICIFPTYVIPEIIIFLFMSRIVKSILNGDSSVGDFSLYIGLFTSLIAATYTVIETFSSVYEDKLKIDTIEKFSKYEEEENRCGELEVNDNIKIEFKNVSFKYPMSEKYVLQNFSLEIKQGDRICILGVNGSGKSTVIKLLLRFYDVDEGEILINSKNIKEYDVCNLRSVFSVVFQDYINYSFTLRDNIKITDLENAKIYGDPDKTDFINLKGKSSSNEIFVDKKESWYINGNMRKDYVELGPDTENNTVHMDEKDETQIWYNQFGVEMDGETVQSEIGYVQVEGKGESSQEEQLKASLSKYQYNYHKRHQ